MANRNKTKGVIKDEYGVRWFVKPKSKKIEPTNWRLFCMMVSAKANHDLIQEKLYGPRSSK